MISKELLSEVLGDERIKGENISVAGNLLHYDRLTHMTYINIYELAHKCKEWAKIQGFFISSLISMSDESGCAEFGHHTKLIDDKLIFEDTEPEAIFKACEWILEQKDRP